MSGDPFVMFQGGDPSDTRFQFEIIKGLADSIRQLTGSIQEMQKTQVNMLERLATLEANKFADAIGGIRSDVDDLMADKQRRDGAAGVFKSIPAWLQFAMAVASIFGGVYLFGRATGVVPAPPVAPTRVEATIHPEERKIEGVVGGKP